jgi:hypothetical protein
VAKFGNYNIEASRKARSVPSQAFWCMWLTRSIQLQFHSYLIAFQPKGSNKFFSLASRSGNRAYRQFFNRRLRAMLASPRATLLLSQSLLILGCSQTVSLSK